MHALLYKIRIFFIEEYMYDMAKTIDKLTFCAEKNCPTFAKKVNRSPRENYATFSRELIVSILFHYSGKYLKVDLFFVVQPFWGCFMSFSFGFCENQLV